MNIFLHDNDRNRKIGPKNAASENMRYGNGRRIRRRPLPKTRKKNTFVPADTPPEELKK